MDGGSPDLERAKVPYEETDEGRTRKAELAKRREEKLNQLRATNDTETVQKVERLSELMTKKGSLSDEELQEKYRLSEELTKQADTNEVLRDIVVSYVEDDIYDDGKETVADDEEAQQFEKQIKGLQDEAKGILFESDAAVAEEKANELRRKIGDIAANGEMRKIKRSQSAAAKAAYGAWMTFLVFFGLFLFTAKTVSKPFSGGNRR